MTSKEEWTPGSFTKNFSWGVEGGGLIQLYEMIKVGFAETTADVPRAEFRERVSHIRRPDFIAMNFFLFNKTINGTDRILADELVFQAIKSEHSPRFDKLALFAFNFSYAGKWKGATRDQRRPALWAFHYIKDRVATELGWNVSRVSARDIEKFVASDPRYRAKTAEKLSTNLNYLYHVGGLSDFSSSKIERWWVDALFLALDRLIEDQRLSGVEPAESEYSKMLLKADFITISGPASFEKELALAHLTRLYIACGGRDRFSDEHVRDRTAIKVPDIQWFAANDTSAIGAVHPTNPRILKTIPRACAMLATYAGFETIGSDDLKDFSVETFVREHTANALKKMRDENILPTMSAEDLMKITREK